MTRRDYLKIDRFRGDEQGTYFAIYGLCEPEDDRAMAGTVRYVGFSKQPAKRFKDGHLKQTIKKEYYSGRWLRRLKRRKKEPVHVLLEQGHFKTKRDWEDAEKKWIAAFGYGKKNCHLTNMTPGGDGVALEGEAGELIREKMRQAAKQPERLACFAALNSSPEHLARLAAWRNSPEGKARLAAYRNSPENKARLSRHAIFAAWRNSPENKTQLAAWGNSPENKARLAALNSSPEHLARLASPENKARLAAYRNSPEGKTKLATWSNSTENKARLAAWSKSPECKAQLTSPERKARITNLNRSRWAAAKAAGCRTLKEYAALQQANSSKA
ncbi:MAG: hypothetical protein JST93_36725 [Acidobacteria bacterium]|nr:hypothetical protein [Acidobacteriota bacterium]